MNDENFVLTVQRIVALFEKIQRGDVSVPDGTDLYSFIARETNAHRGIVKSTLFGFQYGQGPEVIRKVLR